MRAIQMTPALFFQDCREPDWMAHTPVGPYKFGIAVENCVSR